jgi:hypothetical protein
VQGLSLQPRPPHGMSPTACRAAREGANRVYRWGAPGGRDSAGLRGPRGGGHKRRIQGARKLEGREGGGVGHWVVGDAVRQLVWPLNG